MSAPISMIAKSSVEVASDDRWWSPADSLARNWLTNGIALNPNTAGLVVRFARALAQKLAAAEVKYGYSDGWRSPDWMDECRAKLLEHFAKGDPRDVAAYCAFLWHHNASTATPPAVTEAALLRQALKALESCGAAAVEDGGQQWFDDKLVDEACNAIEAALAAHFAAKEAP